MTAAAADQLPLQIKMYTYDRLPVQLATRLLGTTRHLDPFALETTLIRARIAAERITIRAFLRACNSLVLLAPETTQPKIVSRFGLDSIPNLCVMNTKATDSVCGCVCPTVVTISLPFPATMNRDSTINTDTTIITQLLNTIWPAAAWLVETASASSSLPFSSPGTEIGRTAQNLSANTYQGYF